MFKMVEKKTDYDVQNNGQFYSKIISVTHPGMLEMGQVIKDLFNYSKTRKLKSTIRF